MSDPLVPAPPTNLEHVSLDLTLWRTTRLIHHIYSLKHGPLSFNPGLGKGRFHPIAATDGKNVPTFYGAGSIEGAAMETVFRTTTSNDVPRHVPRKFINGYGYAILTLKRAAKILPLSGTNLRRLGLVRASLLEPGPKHYPATARWAEAIHRTIKTAKGITWYSRQFDGAVCLMFFGDRISSKEFSLQQDRGGFDQDDAYEVIAAVANKADIVITES